MRRLLILVIALALFAVAVHAYGHQGMSEARHYRIVLTAIM